MAKKKTSRKTPSEASASPASTPEERKTVARKATKKKASRKKTAKKASKKKAAPRKATAKKTAKKKASKKAASRKAPPANAAPEAEARRAPLLEPEATSSTKAASTHAEAATPNASDEPLELSLDGGQDAPLQTIVFDSPEDLDDDREAPVAGLEGLEWFDEADAVVVDLSKDTTGEDGIAATRSVLEMNDALLAAAEQGDTEQVRSLIEDGASTDARDRRRGTIGWTPLMLAAAFDHTDSVEQLLAAGADPLATDDADDRYAARVAALAPSTTPDQIAAEGMPLGRSAMHIAVAYGRPTVARILADAGSAIDAPDHAGETPLMIAAQAGAHDIAQLLIGRGVDLDRRDGRSGCGAIERAAMMGRAPMVERLIVAGASIESRDLDGRTPLMYAVGGAHYDAARVLLENRSNPCATAATGFCVLCAAVCARGYFPEADGNYAVRSFPEESILPVVELLLRWGAEDIVDGTGLLPSEHAEKLGYQAVVKILDAYSNEEYRRAG